MLLTDMRDWVNYTLGQDLSTTAVKYVSDTQILEWLKEGLLITCLLGKVWQAYKTDAVTLVNGTEMYAYPSTDEGGYACELIDVIDVMYKGDFGNESLTKMDFRNRGKIFTTGTEPIWYCDWADRIWISPVPTSVEAGKTCDMMFIARPTGELKYTGTTSGDIDGSATYPLPIPEKFHTALQLWAAAKGKITYRLFSEAELLMQQFSSLTGVGAEELKSKLGLQ